MTIKLKSGIKFVLRKMGLLPLAIKFAMLLNGDEIVLFFHSLVSYIFNNGLTFFPNHWLRTCYLKYCMGVKLGKSSFVYMGCRFEGDIRVGHNSVLGRNCVFAGDITIGNNVSITAETYIFAVSHFPDSPTFSAFVKPVIIEDHVWIGARAMVFPGVTIGTGAILGAMSSATKNIAQWTIVAGTPAREIGKRTSDLAYTIINRPYFQ